MHAIFLAVLLLASVPQPISMTCDQHAGANARCRAFNTGTAKTMWTAYNEVDPSFFAYGDNVILPVPRRWTVLELSVEDVRLRVWARFDSRRQKVVFKEYVVGEEP